ncbi:MULTISPECIES: GNAT family N-acetyltransferase [Bosea]|uniref:GNAT family N-acetyltransferase n=1 Tax=Bosea TaxID=85413 RepID=UPI002150619A|nr:MULTISPECIES: GNAT family N-acetyltransferase [Bosea]MCR4524082.1 GNAT family N-acetyltransferase [Bosea sp. 47.2.35]MDR6827458.1 GNAT superfamily N-acetyltransferase [Bosea robiniae]MDR6894168.1 GNAT superfamily N-acetyltransferase [Bosea sp. BE109]MDR7137563.1 GNAT superfamily N-acetyltransferase [Bosea sp. BE168]MDR7174263.1 GNAT superfamily N-acetyltransferase [Bosea sp. BE271]
MTELVIRAAEQADLPALQDLYRHLLPEDERCPDGKAAAILENLRSFEGSAVLIGLLGNDLVASCTVIVIPNLTRGGTPYALIENVVTDTRHRNRGLGKAILKTAVDRAWAAGCYKAMLMTGSRKPSTLAFYEAAGFEQSKTGFQARRLPTRAE